MKGEYRLFLMVSNGKNFIPVKVEDMPGKFDLIELLQMVKGGKRLNPLNLKAYEKVKKLVNKM